MRGLTITPPLVNGSGAVDVVNPVPGWNVPVDAARQLGAFVTKTITREPRAGNPRPWVAPWGEGSLVNSVGLANPGIDVVLERWADLPRLLGVPVIASIGGGVDDLPDLAARLEQAGWVAAIELNLSCPNVAGGLVATDPAAVEDVVSRVRARTRLPLLAKLSPAAADTIGDVARAAESAGADWLVVGNTLPVRAVDSDGLQLLGGGVAGGLSGRALHAPALRAVQLVTGAVDVPVIGLGGIDGTVAVQRMFDAGASVVGVGTAARLDPSVFGLIHSYLAERAAASETAR